LNSKNNEMNRLSAYYAAQLLTKHWMQPIDEPHEVFSVTTTEVKGGAHPARSATALQPDGVRRSTKPKSSPAVTVYAVRRPDSQWALLAINKNPKHAARLVVRFKISGAEVPVSFAGTVEVIQFSRQQYAWRDDGPNGHPIRSMPPAHFTREASSFYELPPYSLTVLRGKVL